MDDELVARLRAAGCVFAEDEASVLLGAARSADELEQLVARRVAGEPLEVVVGFADFCGIRVLVDAGVFVPRVRTALMVQVAVEHLARTAAPDPVVVDLCCGTGAVGLAVLAGMRGTVLGGTVLGGTATGGATLVASDVDPAAVACARSNVEPVGGSVVEGDLDAAIPSDLRGRVDVLTCNAPYVPTDAIALMPPEAREHEHRVALDGGGDGLAVVRRVLTVAPRWLAPGGLVVVEAGTAQVDDALVVAHAAGLTAEVHTDDDLGATVVAALRID